MQTRKTIIFGAPYDFFNQKIIENLTFLGFEVIDICFEQRYKYKSLKDRIINSFRKIFLNDNSYKKKLRFALFEDKINQKLENLSQKADYALIIRPDIYPKYFLEKLQNHTQRMVGYQWDGISVFPEVKKIVKYFDNFFVFDPKDVSQNYSTTTNFYFDTTENEILPEVKNQVFFVGTFKKNRIFPAKKLIEQIQKTDFIADISLKTPNKRLAERYKNAGIGISNQFLSLEENHQKVKESAVLVDILNTIHNGLSFRIFEAMKYHKKLITNNLTIKKYDFYNPNNILVLENDKDYEQIPSFLTRKYEPLPQEIYEKYSFTNWIKYMLSIEPHLKIELPQ